MYDRGHTSPLDRVTRGVLEGVSSQHEGDNMQFGEFKGTKAVNSSYKRIKELGLEEHVLDLDTYGFTVLPLEKVAPREFFERVRETILRVGRERTGVDLQLDKNGSPGKYKAQPQAGNQFLLYSLLWEDRIFEEWLMNPAMYALVDYLMRGQQQLSNLVSFVKSKGTMVLPLHVDGGASPDGGLAACGDTCNSAWAMTDYTEEDGCLAIRPGSHRYCRPPQPGEGDDVKIPVEVPAGSLVVWHGNTWHGAYPKKTDGLRLNLTTYICNKRMKPQ